MIFTLRQLLETARHKQLPMYILFIDLVKAYDSVSQAGLWGVLKARGVPADLLQLIKEYYSAKTAQVSAEGVLSEPFELHTGLGQGCCLAPLLFNIYFGAVVDTWLASDPTRLHWLTRIDGLLRRQNELTKYTLHDPFSFQELGYADDLALLTDTLEKLRTLHAKISSHMLHWGLTISSQKTEALVSLLQRTGPLEECPSTDPPVRFSPTFNYLGSYIDWQLTCEPEILHRLDQVQLRVGTLLFSRITLERFQIVRLNILKSVLRLYMYQIKDGKQKCVKLPGS